jgi:hypothetical protein
MPTKATKEPRIPEPGSLRHLLVTHSSKRLYVAPLGWSAENLNLIDWPPPHAIPMPAAARHNSPNPHPSSEDPRVIDALDTLRYLKVKSRRDVSIRQLFRLLVPKQVFKISRYAKRRAVLSLSTWFQILNDKFAAQNLLCFTMVDLLQSSPAQFSFAQYQPPDQCSPSSTRHGYLTSATSSLDSGSSHGRWRSRQFRR